MLSKPVTLIHNSTNVICFLTFTSQLVAQPDLAKDSFPDFYHFKIDGFRPVVEKYGVESEEVKDAEKALVKVIAKVRYIFFHEGMVRINRYRQQ